MRSGGAKREAHAIAANKEHHRALRVWGMFVFYSPFESKPLSGAIFAVNVSFPHLFYATTPD